MDYYAVEPYPPTFMGLEKARGDVRKMMKNIVTMVSADEESILDVF